MLSSCHPLTEPLLSSDQSPVRPLSSALNSDHCSSAGVSSKAHRPFTEFLPTSHHHSVRLFQKPYFCFTAPTSLSHRFKAIGPLLCSCLLRTYILTLAPFYLMSQWRNADTGPEPCFYCLAFAAVVWRVTLLYHQYHLPTNHYRCHATSAVANLSCSQRCTILLLSALLFSCGLGILIPSNCRSDTGVQKLFWSYFAILLWSVRYSVHFAEPLRFFCLNNMLPPPQLQYCHHVTTLPSPRSHVKDSQTPGIQNSATTTSQPHSQLLEANGPQLGLRSVTARILSIRHPLPLLPLPQLPTAALPLFCRLFTHFSLLSDYAVIDFALTRLNGFHIVHKKCTGKNQIWKSYASYGRFALYIFKCESFFLPTSTFLFTSFLLCI